MLAHVLMIAIFPSKALATEVTAGGQGAGMMEHVLLQPLLVVVCLMAEGALVGLLLGVREAVTLQLKLVTELTAARFTHKRFHAQVHLLVLVK